MSCFLGTQARLPACLLLLPAHPNLHMPRQQKRTQMGCAMRWSGDTTTRRSALTCTVGQGRGRGTAGSTREVSCVARMEPLPWLTGHA